MTPTGASGTSEPCAHTWEALRSIPPSWRCRRCHAVTTDALARWVGHPTPVGDVPPYPLYAFCAEQLPDDWREMSSGSVALAILAAAKDPAAPPESDDAAVSS
jgi:hypothetical protein